LVEEVIDYPIKRALLRKRWGFFVSAAILTAEAQSK
jgi:hypothetical protein